MMEGESGTFVIGPLTPQEFLQQIAESGMPGSLFARFCLENQDVQIGQRVDLEITAELNNCPIHGEVDKDHRCPEFDGVLRDAWTGRARGSVAVRRTCRR